MVIESVNGDPDAKYDGFTPDSVQLCIGHYPEYSSEFNFQMNMGGALGSDKWLDAGDPAMVSFHCPHDPFAPYGTSVLVVPTTGEPVIEVTGAYGVHTLINSFDAPNNNDVFQSLNLADDVSLAANEINEGMDGLYPVLNSYVDGVPTEPTDSSPWQWWDVAATQMVDTANGSNIAATQLSLNPTMGPDEALPWLDIIQAYTAPRMYYALGFGEVESVEEAIMNEASFAIFPNPTSGLTTIDLKVPATQASLYSLEGRLVRQWPLVGIQGQFSVDLSDVPSGAYVVQIDGESQRISVAR
jgi:hypothetical protein